MLAVAFWASVSPWVFCCSSRRASFRPLWPYEPQPIPPRWFAVSRGVVEEQERLLVADSPLVLTRSCYGPSGRSASLKALLSRPHLAPLSQGVSAPYYL